jgi:hypothetical protein
MEATMSVRLTEQTDTRPAHSDGDDWVIHDVSKLQWLLGDVLCVKIPRARCGASLVAEPGKTYPNPGEAPTCPKCLIEMTLS